MSNISSKTKSSYIELVRFLLCIAILLHHSGFVTPDNNTILPGGAIAADVFFMLTGYFTIRHIEKMNDVEGIMSYSMKYTLNKMLRLIPYVACGVLIAYLLVIWRLPADTSIMDYIISLENMPFELTLLPMTGVISSDLSVYRNAPMWFLSSMLIVMPVIMYIAIRFKDVFRNYFVWFVPMFLQGWMVVNCGGACPWQSYAGFCYSGVVRAFSGITMGCAIYYASNALSKKMQNSSVISKVSISILEIGLLAFAIYNFFRQIGGYEEVFVIYLFAVSLCISLSGASYTSKLKGRFFEMLGKLSLPIYCVHWGIYQWVGAYLGYLGSWICIGITFVLCIIVSVVMMIFTDKFYRKKQS